MTSTCIYVHVATKNLQTKHTFNFEMLSLQIKHYTAHEGDIYITFS